MKRRYTRRAFTLIELLLVLVILAVLAAVVVPKLTGRVAAAKKTGTIADLSNIKTALDVFESDMGRYPTSDEGLQALINNPSGDVLWHGPYLSKPILVDKYGTAYRYLCPGNDDPTSYDLDSAGEDKNFDTPDDIRKNTEG
jgi:general secretion pathway protein G